MYQLTQQLKNHMLEIFLHIAVEHIEETFRLFINVYLEIPKWCVIIIKYTA